MKGLSHPHTNVLRVVEHNSELFPAIWRLQCDRARPSHSQTFHSCFINKQSLKINLLLSTPFSLCGFLIKTQNSMTKLYKFHAKNIYTSVKSLSKAHDTRKRRPIKIMDNQQNNDFSVISSSYSLSFKFKFCLL